MPDWLAQALPVDGAGLAILALGAFLAGCVRGFSGFGSALVFMPFAAASLPPLWAILVTMLMDIFGPIPNLPRATRDGNPREAVVLSVASLVGMPIGLGLLALMSIDLFRVLVSTICVLAPVILWMGPRLGIRISWGSLAGCGLGGGILGGAVGAPGPPVIVLYMASGRGAANVRANTLMYLVGFDILFLGFLGVTGQLSSAPVLLGLLLVAPSLIGNVVGGAVFNPDREKTYRMVAYAIIIAAALMGLPIWG